MDNVLHTVICSDCVGDACDSALLQCAELSVRGVEEYRQKHRKVCEILFVSTNKFHVGVVMLFMYFADLA